MSGGGAADDNNASTGAKFLALLLVVLFAGVGGFLTKLLKGADIKPNGCCKKGLKIPPVSQTITIPVLVGIIIFGCIARNWFPQDIMDAYPNAWAGWIRTVCLSIILLRGGLELDFEGKGLIVVLLTLVPQMCEAMMVSVISRFVFELPWALCFSLGFILAAVSPAVLVPSCMILQEQRYGVKKGIPTSLIAASSFDDIIAITIFGVCSTSAFAAEGKSSGSPGMAVLVNIYQIAAGLAVGLAAGYSMKVFNRWDPPQEGKTQSTKFLWIKFSILFGAGIIFPIVCDLIEFHESKYIGIIFFGWQCHYHWKHFKPEHELGQVWQWMQIVLFGTVGASVLFDKVEGSMIGGGIVIILCGVSARWVATFMVGIGQGFTIKERAFMGFAWIPKATVQAAIGGVVLTQAETEGDMPEFERYGLKMLTTAVFAIVFTAPLGAILTNTLGPMWLEHNPLQPKSTKEEIAEAEKQFEENAGVKKDSEVGEGSQVSVVYEDLESEGPAEAPTNNLQQSQVLQKHKTTQKVTATLKKDRLNASEVFEGLPEPQKSTQEKTH